MVRGSQRIRLRLSLELCHDIMTITLQSSVITLLMSLRSVRREGVFVLIKALANITLVRLRPLVNSHYMAGSGAWGGEHFGAQVTL